MHAAAGMRTQRNLATPEPATARLEGPLSSNDDGLDGGWDSKEIGRPAIVRAQGSFHMWYSGVDSRREHHIGHANSADGVHWTRNPRNPVFGPERRNRWEELGVLHPSVLFDGVLLGMWYVGHGERGSMAIGYATSTDGVNWARHNENPVFCADSDLPWEKSGLAQPCVLFDGESFWMWYVGEAISAYSRRTCIGCATSPDGVCWRRLHERPVLEPGRQGTWDAKGVFEPTVVLANRRFHMWYSGLDELGINRIGYATSVDGVSWSKSQINPVLVPDENRYWESNGVFNPLVLRISKMYHMWYFGADAEADGHLVRMGYATSRDGRGWRKYEGGPIFAPSQTGRYLNPS